MVKWLRDLHDQSMGVREAIAIPQSNIVDPRKRKIETKALLCHSNYCFSSNFSVMQAIFPVCIEFGFSTGLGVCGLAVHTGFYWEA